MKTKILFVIIIMFYSVKAFSLWDLLIRNHTNDDIEVTMKMLSIPFEGSVHFTQFNRFPPVALNGSIHKRFYNSTDFHQWNILKHVFVLTPGHPNTSEARLRSCFGEESGSLTENFPFWGYGRYLITFKNLDHPEKTLNFYWNSLDSKLGTQDYYNNLSYGSDWSMDYEVINNEYRVNIGGQRIVPHAHNINRYVYSENQFDEFYQWDLILNQSSPVAKEFFGRITPFPISKADAETTIRVLNLETDILMDQVYPNNGTQDRYGYNTINNPYYNNPPVPFSTTGKTIMTPATTFDPDQTPSTGDEVIGIKIVIDQGSKLTIGEDIDFWVHGLLTQGDSLFIDGGTIELKQNAGLYCINGGKIIYNSGNLSFLNTSDIRAFAFTSLEFNISEEINNGSRIKIDGDATLKLGDNVTLTFDGNTSYLDLASNSNIKFGTNSKLVFKNGAYLKADDVTFTGLTTSTIYDGIVLENAGSQTSIKNCTFNNFKTAIKIENTNSTSVNNQKIIQGNDFNYNTASNYGIYAIRLNTALIDDNDFDMSAIGQAGVYIQQPLLDVGEGAGGGEAPTTLNIINNRFNNTGNGIILAGFTSSNIHAFVKGNTTTNSRLGLLARNVSGEIKDNNINASSTQLGTGIFLTESNPDLFDNIIYSYGQSI